MSIFHYSIFLRAIIDVITTHAEEISALDQAIGDGDHLINLQRGLEALANEVDTFNGQDLATALIQTGMKLMSTMGGASGSLYGTLFIAMGKSCKEQAVSLKLLADAFSAGVESVKSRGKADIGEKTMLDTLIPASESLRADAENNTALQVTLNNMKTAAYQGMESTKMMLATKGRASFLGERAIGHIDAGARTSQLMIRAIADVLLDSQ